LIYDIGGNIIPIVPDVAFPMQGIDTPMAKGAYDPGKAPFTFPEGESPESVMASMAVNAEEIYTRIEMKMSNDDMQMQMSQNR